MSSSLLHQQCSECSLTSLGMFVRWEINGGRAAVLETVTSKTCSKKRLASLCSFHLVFSSERFVKIVAVQPHNSNETATA